jgi:hypothetical protein
VLIGEEEGTREAADEFGAIFAPSVERNSKGTPLVSSVFQQATQCASYRMLAYVNSDIILFSDFSQAVQLVAEKAGSRPFLMIGGRCDLLLEQELDDFSPLSQLRLLQQSIRHAPCGLDYFVFPSGLYDSIPPFAIGRTKWDTWLARRALSQGRPVVDATADVIVFHQNHTCLLGDARPKPQLFRGEIELNHRLYGAAFGNRSFLHTTDATHALVRGQFLRNASAGTHPPL